MSPRHFSPNNDLAVVAQGNLESSQFNNARIAQVVRARH